MKLLEILSKGVESLNKRLGGAQEKITVYMYNPREHSVEDVIQHLAYAQSIIAGSYPDVQVSDKEIIQLIIDWIKNPEPVKVFAELLTHIDVKLPVTLKDLTSEYNYAFNCETNDGKTLNITLKFGDLFDSCDEIQVECDGTTSVYNYSSNRIGLTLDRSIVIKNDVKLYNYYSIFSCHRLLTLPDNYEFKLEVDEPRPRNDNQVLVLQNAEAVENYIFNLASTPITSFYTVYERIKECYQFNNDVIKTMKYFRMSLTKKIDDEITEITGALVINYGQLQEYAETKDGVTVFWSKNGNWMYKTLNTLVSFDHKLQKTTVSIICEPGAETIDVNIGSIAKLAEAAVKETIATIIIP